MLPKGSREKLIMRVIIESSLVIWRMSNDRFGIDLFDAWTQVDQALAEWAGVE
jgi:hypothetical protein